MAAPPTDEAGLFYAAAGGDDDDGRHRRPEAPQRLPLLRTAVHTVINDLYATTEVTQHYSNDTRTDIESAVYSFPLHNRAAVTGFQSEVDGVTTVGKVEPKREARRRYETAVAEGRSAQLVEQQSADVFQMSVGGLKAGQEVTVKITHVAVLRLAGDGGDAVEVFVPTFVAPRYNGPPVEGAAAAAATPLSITAECRMASAVRGIDCDTHAIRTEIGGSGADADAGRGTFALVEPGATHLDRSFVATIRTAEPHRPRVLLETSPTLGTTAAAVTLAPRVEFEDAKCELVFVVDRSGSMAGSGIKQARSALQLFLRSLPADCYFNIVGFGSSFETLFPAAVKLDSATLAEATAHVTGLSADLGGTEILEPVLAALGAPATPGYARQLFVLTDGQVGNTDQVVAAVGREQSARCFALGFGHGASRDLVEGIARAGRGTAEFCVGGGSGDTLEQLVVGQLKRAIQPALTDNVLRWVLPAAKRAAAESAGAAKPAGTAKPAGAEQPEQPPPYVAGSLLSYTSPKAAGARRPKALQAPFVTPPVFSGGRLAVFTLGVDPTATGVVVESQTPDGPLSVELGVVRTEGEVLHRLAGRALIQDLEDQRSWMHANGNTPGPSKVKHEIVRLAVSLGLASSHTSFVAVAPATANNGKKQSTRKSKKGQMGTPEAAANARPAAAVTAAAPAPKKKRGLLRRLAQSVSKLGSSRSDRDNSLAFRSSSDARYSSRSGGRSGSATRSRGLVLTGSRRCSGLTVNAAAPSRGSSRALRGPTLSRSIPMSPEFDCFHEDPQHIVSCGRRSQASSVVRESPRCAAAFPPSRACEREAACRPYPAGGGTARAARCLSPPPPPPSPPMELAECHGTSYNGDSFDGGEDCWSDDCYEIDDCAPPAREPRALRPYRCAARVAAPSPSDELQRLILLQGFDGSFQLSEELARAVGKTESELEGLAATLALATGAELAHARSWCAAAVALAFLATALAARKPEWELVEQKTLKWLTGHAGPHRTAVMGHSATQALFAAPAEATAA